MIRFKFTPITLIGLILFSQTAFADDTLLIDNNGSGGIEIAAFGDSIVKGVGDFEAAHQKVFSVGDPSSEASFPLRIESLLQIPVTNMGRPGEVLSTSGLGRFAAKIPSLRPDIVIIHGGSNDAFNGISTAKFSHSVQAMINIAKAHGITPILANIPPSCCNHSQLPPRTNSYNQELRNISAANEVVIADNSKAFLNVCGGNSECYLLNLPEGLHPNVEGYDVMGETSIAALLGIDLFAPDGPTDLESALGLPAGSVKTVPDAVQ